MKKIKKKSGPMECSEFVSLINSFNHGTLDEYNLKRFLIHLDKCKSCREELEIMYLVDKTMTDELKTYDLEKALSADIENAKDMIYVRERNRLYIDLTWMISGFFAASVAIYMFFLVF